MTKLLRFLARWSVLAALLCLWQPCFAQYSSNVEGTVSDPSGAVIANAAVTLHGAGTGVDLKEATNATGYYRFSAVAPGDYQVIVSNTGFKTESIAVTVNPEETRGVDVALTPAAGAVNVTVNGVAEALNPEETRVEQTLTSQEISQLPLPNRDVQLLMAMTPGVVGFQNETPAMGYGSTIFAASFQPNYVANGEGLKSNIFLIDDLPVSDDITQGAAMILPNSDMIGQVSLQSQTYSVENGTGSSLQTSFSTKSGGNQFHGAIDYSYAGANVGGAGQPTHAAGEPVTEVPLDFHQNLLLASLGGPIIRDKTFFFGSVEKQNAAIAAASTADPYFTESFANWALAAFPNSGAAEGLVFAPPTRDEAGPTTVTKTAADYGMPCGTPQTVPADPSLTYNIPCDQSVYTVNAIFNQSQPFDGIQWNVRLDQALRGGKDRVYVMYERIDQTLGDLAERPALDSNSPSQNKYLAANYIHLFSSRLLNEFHAGNLRAIEGTILGNPAAASIPYLPILLDSAAGYQFTFPFGVTPFGSQTNKEHTYALRDTLSYSLRNHTIRGGYQFYRGDYFQDSSGIYSRAFVPFYTTDTFSWVSNTAQAGYNLYTIGGTTGKYTPQYYGATSIYNGLWVEDSWKVRSNLTVTAGIRYDDFGNPSKYGSTAQPFVPMFPGAGNTFQQQTWTTVTHIANTAFTQSQNWNFMPRAGFAYTPYKDKTTLLRGGIGLYENVLTPYQIANNLPTQPPNRISLYETSIVPYGNFTTTSAPYGYTYTYPVYGTDPSGNIYSCPAMTDTASCLFSANLNGFVPQLKPEKFLNYSFGLEQQFLHNTVLGVTYAGSHGFDLVYGASASGQGGNADYNLLPGSPTARPTFEWGELNYGNNGLTSYWNALIVTGKHNYRNFTFQANYNWEKATQDAPTTSDSNSTGTGATYNLWKGIYNPKSFHGVSAFDVADSFSFGGVYEVPKFKDSRLLTETVGGWRVGAIVIAQTGTPFTVAHEGEDYQYDGCDTFNGTSGCAGFPTYSGSKRNGFSRAEVLAGAFTTSQFKDPAGFGTGPVTQQQGVNSFRNLGYASVNATVSKGFAFPIPKVAENSKFFLRAEAVNLLNRTNWQPMDNDVTDANFGTVTAANQKRYLQLGGRFEF
jgi:hypothetical protein